MVIRNILPVVVSCHTPLWIKVGLQSFHSQFPEHTVLVVDNNPDSGDSGWESACEIERAWLDRRPYIRLLNNTSTDKTHGAGLDLAIQWCRDNDIEVMLHFEPDCLISGKKWYQHLEQAINQGAWMTGPNIKKYGPIHPCPSMWRVDKISETFGRVPIRDDIKHSRFGELFDAAIFSQENTEAKLESWCWDTGLKLWFSAAVRDKAIRTKKEQDFKHFWCGTQKRYTHEAFYTEPAVFRLADPPNMRFLGHFINLLRNPVSEKLIGREARLIIRQLIKVLLQRSLSWTKVVRRMRDR